MLYIAFICTFIQTKNIYIMTKEKQEEKKALWVKKSTWKKVKKKAIDEEKTVGEVVEETFENEKAKDDE